jgi:hypothetical protein
MLETLNEDTDGGRVAEPNLVISNKEKMYRFLIPKKDVCFGDALGFNCTRCLHLPAPGMVLFCFTAPTAFGHIHLIGIICK